jgi:hypothetical protein
MTILLILSLLGPLGPRHVVLATDGPATCVFAAASIARVWMAQNPGYRLLGTACAVGIRGGEA